MKHPTLSNTATLPLAAFAALGVAFAMPSCQAQDETQLHGEELLRCRHFVIEPPPEPSSDWDQPHAKPVIVSLVPQSISQGSDKTETLIVDLGIAIGMPVRGASYSYHYSMETNTGATVQLEGGEETKPAPIEVGQTEFHTEIALPGSTDGFFLVTTRVTVRIPDFSSPAYFEGVLMYAAYKGQVWGINDLSDWLAGVGSFEALK